MTWALVQMHLFAAVLWTLTAAATATNATNTSEAEDEVVAASPFATIDSHFECKEEDDGNWTDAKRLWCCESKGLGCPFICAAHMDEMDGWTEQKKLWCCENQGIACPMDVFPSYDCKDGDPKDWTEEQRAWCCLPDSERCGGQLSNHSGAENSSTEGVPTMPPTTVAASSSTTPPGKLVASEDRHPKKVGDRHPKKANDASQPAEAGTNSDGAAASHRPENSISISISSSSNSGSSSSTNKAGRHERQEEIIERCLEQDALYSPLMGLIKYFPENMATTYEALSMCRDYCASVKDCSHFTMQLPTRICRLSAVGARKLQFVSAVSGNTTCWKKDGDKDKVATEPATVHHTPVEDCYEESSAWEPLDMPNTNPAHEPNASACQKRCERTPGCTHFSFWTVGKNCHLQDAYAIHQSARMGFVSGPFKCWKDLDPSKWIDKGHRTFVPKDLECVELGTLYSPIMGGIKTFPKSMATGRQAINMCRNYCASVKGCAHFTIQFPARVCRVAAKSAHKLHPFMNAVSGNTTCWQGRDHKVKKPPVAEAIVRAELPAGLRGAGANSGVAAVVQPLRRAIRATGAGLAATAGLALLLLALAAALPRWRHGYRESAREALSRRPSSPHAEKAYLALEVGGHPMEAAE
mmetsp:Transcript_69977/g.135047  ORF Transcript_69977/g.135047 Transcript_69977/m.135047 type:complete len:639 (-) Transcript_69977:39-1955(-)